MPRPAFAGTDAIDPRRIEALMTGKLDTGEIVALAQDAILAGQALDFGPGVFRVVRHCIDMRLCTAMGDYLQ